MHSNLNCVVGDLNYEKRIKDLAHNKIVQSKLSSRVIETWLNDTMTDANHLDIPGIIMKPENKTPLTRYGIDRNQLMAGGLPHHTIDRIYRALFVYSIGFYEMLTKSLSNSSNKDLFQSAIWRVFAVLLEYCCRQNYKMLVSKIAAEHKDQLEGMEKELGECHEKLYDNDRKRQVEVDALIKENNMLKKQYND